MKVEVLSFRKASHDNEYRKAFAFFKLRLADLVDLDDVALILNRRDEIAAVPPRHRVATAVSAWSSPKATQAITKVCVEAYERLTGETLD